MNIATLTTVALHKTARIPATLSLGLLAVAIACVPSAAEILQFDRAALASGELWRLATCHVTHWSVEHLQWDLLMFVVLGAMCEMRNRRRMWLCTVAAATGVSTLVVLAYPDITAYRGLSGIDTALFTLLAIDLLRDAWRLRNWPLTVAIGGLLFGFAAKTTYEAVTGSAFFVDQQLAGFELLVWDHVVAGLIGLAIAFGSGLHDRSFLNHAFSTRCVAHYNGSRSLRMVANSSLQ